MSEWQDIRALVTDTSKSSAEQRVLKQALAKALGVTDRTINNWVAQGKETAWPGASEKHKENLVAFFLRHSIAGDGYLALATALSSLLKLEQSKSDWDEYLGSYTVLRLGNKDRFIEGKLEISKLGDSGFYYHRHSSVQMIEGQTAPLGSRQFDHEGPVVFVTNRIYFLGCGTDPSSRYFRPKIALVQDMPHQNVTYGVVLTETYPDNRPMSSAFAMISQSNPDARTPAILAQVEENLLSTMDSDKSLKGIVVP